MMKFLPLILLTCFSFSVYAINPPDGKYRETHKNGKTSIQGYYRNGQKHKIWIFYTENGTITHKEKWKNGHLLWQAYYDKGKITHLIDKNGKVTQRPKCGC